MVMVTQTLLMPSTMTAQNGPTQTAMALVTMLTLMMMAMEFVTLPQ